MSDRSLLQESLVAIERLQARLDRAQHALHEPIAIIGAGCRYPGGVETPEALWRLVRDGTDAVVEVPADRWDVDAHYDANPQALGKMITRRGGFLSQVDQFDPQFFGISPREAITMDPQQRLLLEVSQEALEDAGLATDSLAGSITGVFVGITLSEYALLPRAGGAESDVYSATGSVPNAAAGRISFTFGLRGPCISIDTACSSSLVAVHMACQSLRTGESNLALAGGVNVVLSPAAMIMFSKWGMMAPDGRCRTFDAAADGFVRAEGCAVLALKRLSDAVATHDPVLAVIRGSAVNSDGRSSGLTVPNGPAQEAVLRAALANACIEPSDIDYIEAHGTGTPLGDPIEVEAIGAVMRERRPEGRPVAIGSIKPNIGHAEAASGLAGLLKVVMALRHETIPPQLHFTTPNPNIPWDELPVTVSTKSTPWPRGGRPRRAGVSSFGFSGTNAHVILEEAPPRDAVAQPTTKPYLVPLSARDDAALRALALHLADHLLTQNAPTLADVATTLANGRAHMQRRIALIADSSADLERGLRGIARGEMPVAVDGSFQLRQPPKVAFLFTGQGAQYAGMGQRLYEAEPVFRAVLDTATTILAPLLECPLLQVLFPTGEPDAVLSQTAYTQPALFAVEYALAELWRSWGIVPSIVTGHSVGEYVAACVAGVFSFEDGLRLVAERGRLMQALPAGGGMAAVFARDELVARRIAAFGGQLSIAAMNSSDEIVVAGDLSALATLLDGLAEDGVKSKMLDVSHAFHSRRLDPMLDALERCAEGIVHGIPRMSLISNLTGAVFPDGTGPDARYWREHARRPVRFADGIAALRASGATVLVEVGPHPALLSLVARAVPQAQWTTLASLRREHDDRREMLVALAALYQLGASVRWDVLATAGGGRRVSLPTYPFQRERYWVTAPSIGVHDAGSHAHPLLGTRHELASLPGTYLWERDVSLDSHPWLTDHRVQGVAIMPATAYIEMAIAAAGEVLGGAPLSVCDVENLKPMILPDGVVSRLQATLTVEFDGSTRFSAHSRPNGTDGPWVCHMTARIVTLSPSLVRNDIGAALDVLKQRSSRELSGENFYAALATKGNRWGPCFRGIQHLWCGPDEVLGRVQVVSGIADDMSRYRFHPAIADSCAHALVALGPLEASNTTRGGALVGGGVREVRFHQPPVGQTLWAHAKLSPRADEEADNVLTGNISVYDESGALVCESLDARLWYLDETARNTLLGAPPEWFYEVRWRSQPLGGPSRRSPKDGTWLIFADDMGLAKHIAAARRAPNLQTFLVSGGDSWSAHDGRVTIRPDNTGDYERLLAIVESPAVILHLWSVNSLRANDDSDSLAAGAILSTASVLNLLHAIRTASNAPRPRLWLATVSTQAVRQGDSCDLPLSAAMWGIGKSLAVEHPELWGGLVDLSTDVVVERDAKLLIREIETATVEDNIAFRDGQRYVARLERRGARRRTKFTVRSDGTYLVTGGLGGIGLAAAKWLAEQGAKHLLLVGRTALASRSEWSGIDPTSSEGGRVAGICAIEALGACVETAAVDVSDKQALRTCLQMHAATGRPAVCGVIHAAGVLQLEALESQSIASFRVGLSAKMAGAWHLHCLLADHALDCFVLCSSSSALLNSPLLGGYAAGNAFLDALAHHRRARGLAALSVNWGTWGEVGMAADAVRSAGDSSLNAMDTIPTALGLAALSELLQSGDVQAAVMPVDWERFARGHAGLAGSPFLEAQITGRGASAGAGAPSLTLAALREMVPDARMRAVSSYLQTEAARVLGLAAERLDTAIPLSSFGFDSLMAVQLKNRIEVDIGAVVPMIRFLQGPSVQQLSSPVLEAVEALDGNLLVAASDQVMAWEEGTL